MQNQTTSPAPDAAGACPDCHMPRAWHFADSLDRGYLVCPCAECARRPSSTEALDVYGTSGDVCDECARLAPKDRNFAPERRSGQQPINATLESAPVR